MWLLQQRMEVKALDGLKDILSNPKRIFITTHFKPDGDAVGSSLALYHFLMGIGHQVTVAVPSEVPEFLRWIPGAELILNFEKSSEQVESALRESELVFCLDFNKFERVQDMAHLLRNSALPKVLIDHHLYPELELFQYVYSSPEKSSTAEMVYDFIQYLELNQSLSTPLMQAIYTGMLTDTGSFRFPATSASVHQIVSDFKLRGFNHSEVHEAIYDNWSAERMKFMGYLFHEKLVAHTSEGFAYIFISQEDLKKYQVGLNDTEGIVNMVTSIAQVRVGVLITDRAQGMKLSFRSKGNIDVNQFAKAHFGGGGHFNASGASTSLPWKKVQRLLEENLPVLIRESVHSNN